MKTFVSRRTIRVWESRQRGCSLRARVPRPEGLGSGGQSQGLTNSRTWLTLSSLSLLLCEMGCSEDSVSQTLPCAWYRVRVNMMGLKWNKYIDEGGTNWHKILGKNKKTGNLDGLWASPGPQTCPEGQGEPRKPTQSSPPLKSSLRTDRALLDTCVMGIRAQTRPALGEPRKEKAENPDSESRKNHR